MTNAPPRRPEVLAPAGDEASLRAAVRAGADAVYFGLQGFNARARATNFDAATLGATVRFLHEHGARGYVTLNTLVFDHELGAVEAAVRACAAAGVDAVIVQDLGVARLARAVAPSLPIHASTQMTCTDAGSVELAREAGASRVILARELSLDDLRAIRAATDVELEVFVHGALCVAYSGQCLTSEAIGGRSANRGACAQACRLPYELVVDGERRDTGDRAYLLSPEDQAAVSVIPDLVALGVASLKIEGRLKGPEYVAATTRLYRAAVAAALGEAPPPDRALRDAALQTFSRGSGEGFFRGVDHQRLVEGRNCDHRGLQVGSLRGVERRRGRSYVAVRLEAPVARGDGLLVEGGAAGAGEFGGSVWAITQGGADVPRAEAGDALLWFGPERTPGALAPGRRVWKTRDDAVERSIREAVERDPRRQSVAMTVRGAVGEAPVFEAVTASGLTARVTGDAPVERAVSRPLTEPELREKLGRLGDTPFALGELSVDLPEGVTLPLSSINRARRALVDALREGAARAHPTADVTWRDVLDGAALPAREPPPGGLFVLCRTLPQARAALAAGADGVILDFLELTGTGAAVRALRAEGAAHITLCPPRIRKPGEEKVDRYLASLAPDAVLVRGLGALREGAGDVPRVGDFSLNVTNRLTAAAVLARGLAAFTPSFDLDAAQLAALVESGVGPWAEVVVHHPMPLFHMEHCVIAALLSDGGDHRTCGRPCERHVVSLRDRAGMDHPVEADVGCRNTVFHAAAQSAAGVIERCRRAGVRRWRVELVRETPAEVGRVVAAYRALTAGAIDAQELWRRLRAEGERPVVRGSLRVIHHPGG
ncbi:MAG: U32 family peptidase [Polyangiales bacterium]